MDPFDSLNKSYKNYYGTRGVFDCSNIFEKYLLSDDDLDPKNKYEEIVPSGYLYTCGLNDFGQLGINDSTPRSSPVQIAGAQWIKSTCGWQYTLALKSDGTLWAWGRNDNGQLGVGDAIHRSSPTQIPGTYWKDVIASSGNSSAHTLALRTDGTLWAWGLNDNGQLGLNDKLTRYSPVQILGSGWKELSIGREWSGVLKDDGTYWTWGLNGDGQLGLNDRRDRSSPTQIIGNNWAKVGRFGGRHNSAITTDGILWTWGLNTHGALGQLYGTFGSINLSSPTQISGHKGWTFVCGGEHHTVALKDDDTYWGWGHNNHGQAGLLANPTTLEYPVQGRNYGVVHASAGQVATYTLEKGSCTKSVGYNADGNLGVFDRTDRNSPVQMPGQGWVAGGGRHSTMISHLNYNLPPQTLSSTQVVSY